MIRINIRDKKMKKKGAIVAILDNQNRILLGERPTDITCWAPGKWAFPGGHIERGETPEEAAIRETKEEMNLDIRDLKELELGKDNGAFVFYTRSYDGDVTIDHEHTDWAWVSRDNVEQYPLAPYVLEMYDWVLQHD